MADAPGIPVAMTRALIWIIPCARAASPSTTAIPAIKAIIPGKLIKNFDEEKHLLIANSSVAAIGGLQHGCDEARPGGPRSSAFYRQRPSALPQFFLEYENSHARSTSNIVRQKGVKVWT
jgi:hypothetical protein